MLTLSVIAAAFSLFFADAPTSPVCTAADQILLMNAQLSAERADHAVDKAKADYLQAVAARDKAFSDAQKVVDKVLSAYGCSPSDIQAKVCQLIESGPDKDGHKHLTVKKTPPAEEK